MTTTEKHQIPAFKTEMGCCHEIEVMDAKSDAPILRITASALLRLVAERDDLLRALEMHKASLEKEKRKILALAACLGTMAVGPVPQ